MSPRYFFSGQSLLEVIVALAIFSLIAGAFVTLTLGSISSVNYGTDFLVADAFADQGVGEIRARRDNAWNDLTDGTEVETIDGRFERTITVSPVDLETKLLEVEVKWSSPVGQIQTVSRQTRLTNWDSRDWIQTDWSDGNGQISWFDPARYDSDDGKVDVTTIGEVKLKELPVAWSLFVDTDVQPWNDLWLLSPTDGFAVGGVGQIRRWNGSNWDTALASGTTQNLNAIHCSSASNCFAVGGSGQIVRWNGTAWSLFVDTGSQTWNDVFMITATDGFVVGSGGDIRRWNGSNWDTTLASGTTRNLNAIHCSSASNCFAVGGSGQIVRWNGTAWSPFVDTGVQPWNDLWLLSPTDGFAVGGVGQIRRWNGSNWDTALASGTTKNLNAIHCSSASNCFAVGGSGQIIRWNGTMWSVYSPSPTPQNLNALFLLSKNSGWATGNSGVIIRFAGGGYETSGLLASSAFDVSDPSPVQIIGWDEIIPACSPACSIKFNIKTAATLAGLASIPWSPDFTLAAGTIINASYNGQRFVQYQVRLTGDGLSTPVLQEVRLNYK
ncbi:MAG TPA: hypothetical protein VJB69_02735 [Candidatus Paceibacterota bacterium]